MQIPRFLDVRRFMPWVARGIVQRAFFGLDLPVRTVFGPGTSRPLRRGPNTTSEIRYTRDTFEESPFAAYMVNIAAEYAAGSGLLITYNDRGYDRELREWRPLIEAPEMDIRSVLWFLMVELIVTGDVFTEFLGNGQIQVIGAERLQSIKRDEFNRAQEYDFTGVMEQQYPGVAIDRSSVTLRPRPVPASRLLHVYRKDRPEYVRGVSWLRRSIPSLLTLGAVSVEEVSAAYRVMQGSGVLTVDPTQLGEVSEDADKDTAGQPDITADLANAFLRRVRSNNWRGLAAPKDTFGWLDMGSKSLLEADEIARIWVSQASQAAHGFGMSTNTLLGWNSAGGYSGNAITQSQDRRFFERVQRIAEQILLGLLRYRFPSRPMPEIIWPGFLSYNPMYDMVNLEKARIKPPDANGKGGQAAGIDDATFTRLVRRFLNLPPAM